MFSQLLGKYLVENKVITDSELRKLLNGQSQARVRLGTIAVADKLLTDKQAEEINHLQTQMDKRFGDIAVEMGYLTEEQVKGLLEKQGSAAMKFIQQLTENKYVEISELDKYLTGFQKDNGFSAQEMKALKDDDIDAVIPFFAFSSKPYVTEIAGLVLRNIMRFVTSDFYMDRIKKVDSFDYSYIMGQKLAGDSSIYLGFAAADSVDGILELAAGFLGEKPDEVNDAVLDAVCEFANMNDGIFASELSNKDINLDMEPPFIYKDGQAKGSAYVMPVSVKGRELYVYIAVDSDVAIGDTPYQVQTDKAGSAFKAGNGKADVLIADDSQLIRRMLRTLLEESGYAVAGEAADGKEAVEEYKRLKPDVVTLDITMPVLDGVGALKGIMEYDADAKVIMITAAGQRQKIVEALKLGAKAFIMKPFDREDVLKNLTDII